MKSPNRLPRQLSCASTLVLVACGALAQQAETYTPLALANRPAPNQSSAGFAGEAQLGVGYSSDDNYTFGQYNGLYQDQATIIGNLQWQDYRGGESYWQASVSDLGLDTRQGELIWGKPDRMRLRLGFDSQLQVRNNSGRTPFRGSSQQQLPPGWDSGLTTSDWSALDESLRQFDRELQRDHFFVNLETRLNEHWALETAFSYEEKSGESDVGGAIYIDASSGDSVLLRAPVDYSTSKFDMGLTYSEGKLQLDGRFHYSDFDNNNDELTWQNPYSSFGPDVAYPAGEGGLGTAPDNELASGRLSGQYVYSSRVRLQFDGSYGVASQNQNYRDYTVNPLLLMSEPLPAKNLDGEVATSTFNARILLQPLNKLNAEIFHRYRDRDYDVDRDGYRYVRGDGSDQPGQAGTVYNTNHDFRSRTTGFEAGYRLPLRSKLSFEYQYEIIDRNNAAVAKTEEDRYSLGYRIQPWSNFTARLEIGYADRKADTYQWDQSYYALLDPELINATPDNQRYINHPRLSQFYLSNREQYSGKADFTWLPSDAWNLNLNLQWRDDDYDESDLGLTEAEWSRSHIGATFIASETLSAGVYAGYDYYETAQSSRAFRGGQEKNAFAVYPPLPQASDPTRDWDIDSEDTSITAGANLQWQVADNVELAMDYSFVRTEAEQDLSTRASGGLIASDLPEVETRMHHVQISGTWHMQDNLSLRLDYQYYRYKSDDWAWDGVQADTIDKVLSFGQRNPNDQINYVGASVIYRWQ